MNVNRQIDERVRQLCAWYGDGQDASCPSADQWRRILERPADKSVTLINFFKLREIAEYPSGTRPHQEDITGQQAFDLYASVSMSTMERVGGKFLLVGPFEGMFLGEDEDWDLIAVGSYTDTESLMRLYTDPGYRAAYPQRTAACKRQKVIVCSG